VKLPDGCPRGEQPMGVGTTVYHFVKSIDEVSFASSSEFSLEASARADGCRSKRRSWSLGARRFWTRRPRGRTDGLLTLWIWRGIGLGFLRRTGGMRVGTMLELLCAMRCGQNLCCQVTIPTRDIQSLHQFDLVTVTLRKSGMGCGEDMWKCSGRCPPDLIQGLIFPMRSLSPRPSVVAVRRQSQRGLGLRYRPKRVISRSEQIR
jgi:hypothetical protein